MPRYVKLEPNWRGILDYMNTALATNSVVPAKREEFQKSRDEVAAYVAHLGNPDKEGK